MTVVLRNCAALLLGITLAAQARGAQPLGCLIEPFQVADVGSPVIGVIEKIHVERGDLVRKGQPLAVLRADVERAQLGVASSKAQANAEVNAALANASLAKQKLARAEDLLARQFISRQALEQAVAEARVADERVVQAREQKRTAEREFELAQAQVGMRTIRAPSDGVIADRYLSVGERVEEKPVFRVSMVDPLRVEVVMPAQLFGTVSPNATLTITPEFPNAGPREARVVLVDKLIDGASNTFRIRLSLPNPGARLPAGLRCKASLAGTAAAAEVPPAKTGRFKKIADAEQDGLEKAPARRGADAPLRMEYSLPNPKPRK